jgi:hypothetical protein
LIAIILNNNNNNNNNNNIGEVTAGIQDGGQIFLDKTKKVHFYEYRRGTH